MRAPRPRRPRYTARLRLTILYGAVFLVCATALLGITYLLVAKATNPPSSFTSPPLKSTGHPMRRGQAPAIQPTGHPMRRAQAPAIQQAVLSQAASDRQQLLIQSGIALGIVSVAAFALGWLAAGRILRPLATITATARRISATSLGERLDLRGPDDELKELGDTLDSLFDRFEASFEAQRHFIANASHELRTPLSADRTLLQVALDEPAATVGMWRATGEELLASNTEQERLIEALLTLASSQAGLHHREAVDLSAVTSAVLLAPRPETSRLGLHIEVTSRPAILHGDPVLAERLVANLADNAVRHNIPGGHVQITTRTRGGRAILSVTNTGPAIPPGTVDRLFQPFQRLHPHRASNGNGNGLGLSIVRAIATAHDATITAQAQPGGGLAIDVTFPPPPDGSRQPATTSLNRTTPPDRTSRGDSATRYT
jgi:signal transduction histidine kinase